MALSALAIAGVTAAAASVASSAIGAGVSAKVSKDQNETNTQNVKETNEANLQAVRETNAANAEQAELAYERSKPVTQIRNLMQSGMSHAGALNLLQGGGSYSAPTMQTASADAPQVDYSGIIDAIERLEGIPANAMQFSLQGIQAQQVQDELRMKREEHEMNRKALEERLQRERDEELRKQYGQNAVEMTDKLSTEIYDLADKYGVNLDEITSENDLVQKLHLNKSSIWRAAPASAKQSAIDSARARAAEFRANEENKRAERAAEDAHNLSVLEQQIKKIDVKYYDKEKHEQLLNLIRTGQNLVQDGNIKFQDYTAKEMENFVRSAGINSEHDARALAAYVNKLEKEDEMNMAEAGAYSTKFTREGRTIGRLLLRDFGEILSRVKLP